MLNRFELPLVLTGLALVLLLQRRNPSWVQRPARAFARLANRRALAVVVTGLFALVSSAAVSLCVAWPVPRIHDEFSYLLAADTFARGRLTNPPHPLWVHFESFHVNYLPTYCSIYPPAQGLFLALGQFLGGYSIVGVWISFALASAAVCWMLQGWAPPRWAFLGGLLAAVRVGFLGSWAGMQGYWSQSFWGGAVAMLGGALVFGSLPRLVRRPSTGQAISLALGLAILANSRPFEGMLAAAPAALALVLWLFGKSGPSWSVGLSRVALPVAAALGLTAAGMAYYNQRLTGNPLLLPYQHNSNTYGNFPLFLWQPLQPERAYHHEMIRTYHTAWAREQYLQKRTPSGYVRDVLERLRAFGSFFLGSAMMLPLVPLPWMLKDRWTRFAALTCATVLAGLCVTTWFQPHYAAPVTGLLFALVVRGLRHLRLWRWDGRPVGRAFVRAVPLVYAGLLAVAVGIRAQGEEGAWFTERQHLIERLEGDGGRHVILVRYAAGYPPTQEWVYNAVDIDASRVVWARDMGPQGNRPVLDYFAGRSVWLLEVDEQTVRFEPYAAAAGHNFTRP